MSFESGFDKKKERTGSVPETTADSPSPDGWLHVDPHQFYPIMPSTLNADGTLDASAPQAWGHPEIPGKNFTEEEMNALLYQINESVPHQAENGDDHVIDVTAGVSAEASPEKARDDVRTGEHPTIDVVAGVSADADTQSETQTSSGNGGGSYDTGAGGIYENAPQERPTSQEFDAKRWDIKDPRYNNITPLNIPDIIADAKHAQLFGEFMEYLVPDQGDLFARARANKITDDERRIVTWALHEYPVILKHVEDIKARFKMSDFELMMQRDERIMQQATTSRKDRLFAHIMNELPHIAMRNPGSVDRFLGAYNALIDERSTYRYKQWDTRVRTFLEKRGITQGEFASLGSEKGEIALRKELRKRYRDETGEVFRRIDWALTAVMPRVPSYERRADETVDRALQLYHSVPTNGEVGLPGTTAEVLGRIDTSLALMTSFISQTVNLSDEEIERRKTEIEALPDGEQKHRLQAEVTGMGEFKGAITEETWNLKEPARAREEGPRTEQSFVQEQQKEVSKMKEYFERDRANHTTPDGRGWDNMSIPEREQYRDEIWDARELRNLETREQQLRGQGFWAALFRALFSGFIKAEKKKLSVA